MITEKCSLNTESFVAIDHGGWILEFSMGILFSTFSFVAIMLLKDLFSNSAEISENFIQPAIFKTNLFP